MISLKVSPGEHVSQIVSDHGDSPANLRPVFSGPFDDIARDSGLDRFFVLTVHVGQEGAKAQQYAVDPRIESAQLENNQGVCELSRTTVPA